MIESAGVPLQAACAREFCSFTGTNRAEIAIAFADIVGYSTLMAADGPRTHASWNHMLAHLVRPEAGRHGGRIVQVMGDGVLAEFPDVEAAFAWAAAVQNGAVARPALAADDRPITLRIAIHCGRVTRDGEGIFGEDVNIAARLQEHAEPAGILLSGEARAGLGDGFAEPLRDLGHLRLKNIDRPVRAFALGLAQPAATVPARHAEAELPSVAVLPFRSAAGDPADAYFADGVIEDVILSLAALRELTVIARESTLTARETARSMREIGRLLGVRYVVSGSVARRGGRIRVHAELAETESGATLWAERDEAPIEGLFDLQDRMVERIVAGLAPQVRSAELQRALRKHPGSVTAYDDWLRAIDLMSNLDKARFLGGRTLLDRALAEDPRFAMAAGWSAQWHSLMVGQGWSGDIAADRSRAAEMARLALALDPRNAMALTVLGHLTSFHFRDAETGLAHLQAALVACPNFARGWMYTSCTLSYLGRGTEALRHAEHATRLSPMDQWQFQFSLTRAIALYAGGDLKEAARWAAISFAQNPHYTSAHRYLAAAKAAIGRLDEAAIAVRALLEHEPDFRVCSYMATRQPFRDPRLAERYGNDLRRAGLPD